MAEYEEILARVLLGEEDDDAEELNEAAIKKHKK
jgi:hypothetical protein